MGEMVVCGGDGGMWGVRWAVVCGGDGGMWGKQWGAEMGRYMARSIQRPTQQQARQDGHTSSLFDSVLLKESFSLCVSSSCLFVA